MTYFVCPLHEPTPDILDANGSIVKPATGYSPGVGTVSPYDEAILPGGCRVFYTGSPPQAGADTVLVVAPAGAVSQDGWVEKTQAEAQILFPNAWV